MRRRLMCWTAVLWAALTGQAVGQEAPVTLVVPYPPGGFVDNVARALARPLGRELRLAVVVVNRAGGNGDLGHAFVANALADGRTLLLAAPSLAAQPAIDELFGKRATPALDRLLPVAQVTADPAVFLVHPGLGVTTLDAYLALARQRPGQLAFASSGAYGATHLPVAMLEMLTGVRLLHVPTSGGAQAMTMTLGNHTTAVAAAPSVAFAHMKSGRLIPLGQTGAIRLPALPQVPTFRESGVDLVFNLWTALLVPRGTPARTTDRLQAALRTAVEDADFRSALAAGQSTLAYEDGPAFQERWRDEVRRLQDVVRHIGKVDDASR